MAQIGKKILSNASIFYIFPLNIVSLTIGANIGSCPRTTPPSPTAFSISRHFRALWPHTGLMRLLSLSFVVISIMTALKILHEVTACIYKGEEKPVMKW